MTEQIISVRKSTVTDALDAMSVLVLENDFLRAVVDGEGCGFDEASAIVESGNRLYEDLHTDEPIPYELTSLADVGDLVRGRFDGLYEQYAAVPKSGGDDDPLYTLRETTEILEGRGHKNVGPSRLRAVFNLALAWTDAYNAPRQGIEGKYLVTTEPANPTRDAVVKVTPQGVNAVNAFLNSIEDF